MDLRAKIKRIRGAGGIDKLRLLMKSKQTRSLFAAFATWKSITRDILETERLDAIELERQKGIIGRALYRFSRNLLGISFVDWAEKIFEFRRRANERTRASKLLYRVSARLNARNLSYSWRTWVECLTAHKSVLRSQEWGLKLLGAYLTKNKDSALLFALGKWKKMWRKASDKEARRREGIEFLGKVALRSKVSVSESQSNELTSLTPARRSHLS